MAQNYTLAPNESIIMKVNRVSYNDKCLYANDLIITNLHIILIYKSSFSKI